MTDDERRAEAEWRRIAAAHPHVPDPASAARLREVKRINGQEDALWARFWAARKAGFRGGFKDFRDAKL